MEKDTYYSVAAKWWLDEARKLNEDYGIGLWEESFKDSEEKLANAIKNLVEYLIKNSEGNPSKYSIFSPVIPYFHANVVEYFIKNNKKIPSNCNMGVSALGLSASADILKDAFRYSGHTYTVLRLLPATQMLVSPTLVFTREFRIWEHICFDAPCSVDSDHVIFESE